MTDLSTLHYFLGLKVLLLCDGFFISQSKYVMDLLTHFKMVDCKPCDTPFHSGVNLKQNLSNTHNQCYTLLTIGWKYYLSYS
jgi:RNase P subunit RPR2